MIIDAYAHCSRKKYLPIEVLEEASAGADIDGTLLIQHEGEFDNSYLASIVAKSLDRYKAVCLVDTRDKDAAQRLEGLLDGSALGVAFVGARMTRNMIDEGTECLEMLDKHKGTIVLHLPDGIDRHLKLIEHIARTYPRMTIYVPHLGWPVVNGKPSADWRVAVRQLSDIEQIVFGLSAIHHFSATAFPYEDIWPHVQHVVKTMGAQRTVWASDFPLLLEGATIEKYLRLFTEEKLGVDRRGKNSVLSATAVRCWEFREKKEDRDG